jgi:transcription elongation factor/antiterminator RfaH
MASPASPMDPATSAESRRWLVVYSKPRKEGSAQFHLTRRGVEVFAPKMLLPAYLERRTRLVPLFPSYLFVHIDPEVDFYTVLWTPGVSRFVASQGGTPAQLDPAVVAFLKERADGDGVITARADLKVGAQVEVTRGPFDGLMGIITRPPDAKGRVKVLMQLLNRQPVRVDISVHSLRAAWVV